MVKFILLVVIFLFVTRMVLRVLRVGVRFFRADGSRRSEHASASRSPGRQIEEADYEVIDSHLNDNEGKVSQ